MFNLLVILSELEMYEVEIWVEPSATKESGQQILEQGIQFCSKVIFTGDTCLEEKNHTNKCISSLLQFKLTFYPEIRTGFFVTFLTIFQEFNF